LNKTNRGFQRLFQEMRFSKGELFKRKIFFTSY
jgi:hypothetical protein